MPVLEGVKCLHVTLLSEHHTSKLMQKVYFVSSDPETLQTTNICSSKLFPLLAFFPLARKELVPLLSQSWRA